jgi:hypothetical protein
VRLYGLADNGVYYKPRALKVYSYAAAVGKVKQLNKIETDAATRITVQELTDSFLAERRTTGITEETEAIYKRVGARLVEFCRTEKI